MKFARVLLILLITLDCATADDEFSPSFYVVADQVWFAKCIPSGSRDNREEGKTLVYRATPDEDTLLYTFDWYSSKIYIRSHSVVRFGPWARGMRASEDDLGIAFYWEGKLLKRYSTLDLAGRPENVRMSNSHYTVIKTVVGYVDIFKKVGNDTLTSDPGSGFEIILEDGRKIVFDFSTGEPIQVLETMFTR